MRRFVLVLGLVLSAFSPDVQAQPRPVGGPVPIALDNGSVGNFGPSLAGDSMGNYVIAWTRGQSDGVNFGEIVFRKFKPNGQPAGRIFQVNEFEPGYQQNAAAALNAHGELAITWNSIDQDGDSYGAYARLFRGRAPLSSETPVPTHTEGDQQYPEIGIDSAGRFTVVWESAGQDSVGGFDAWARQFDEEGEPLADPFRLNFHRDGAQSNPDIAMNPDGSFVVVWRSWNQAAPGAGVYGRRFDAEGQPLGGEFRIHQSTIPSEGSPTVTGGMDGSFIVAWDRCDFSNFLAGCAVLARRYDASGKAAGNEFLVSEKGAKTNLNPAIALDSRGNFAIAWELCDSHPSGQPLNCRVATRFYDRQGKAFQRVQVIESDNVLFSPGIIGFEDQFLVVWESIACDVDSCGQSPQGIYAQRYVLRTKD